MFADSLVALVTPMTADEAIDLPAWQRLIEFHIVHGTAGVVVGGTTGESATLTEAELLQLVREVAAIMQEYTQSGGVRPFGVSLLIAGTDADGPQLYQARSHSPVFEPPPPLPQHLATVF